jgi:hypothetical protein
MTITTGDLTKYFDYQLGEVKTTLNLSDSDYLDLVAHLLLDYGIDTIFGLVSASYDALLAGITDKKKFYSLSKVGLWRWIMGITVGKYHFSADGGSYDRQQIHDMAKANYELAVSDAISYDPNYAISIGEMDSIQNPYEYDPDRLDMRL